MAKNSTPINIVVRVSIVAPLQTSFDYIVPVDLSHIFHRFLLVPGVKRTDEPQKWVAPGLSRTVYFDDGSTAKEELLTVVPSESFSYKISEVTGINRLLVTHIMGEWQFAGSDDETNIVWTYSLHARNAVTRAITNVFVAPMLRVFLQRALDILKRDLEKEK